MDPLYHSPPLQYETDDPAVQLSNREILETFAPLCPRKQAYKVNMTKLAGERAELQIENSPARQLFEINQAEKQESYILHMCLAEYDEEVRKFWEYTEPTVSFWRKSTSRSIGKPIYITLKASHE